MSLEGAFEGLETLSSSPGGDPKLDAVWSPAKRIAFRIAFAVSALSVIWAVDFLKALIPYWKRPLFGALFDHWDFYFWDTYFRTIASIGAFIIRTVTGGKWSIHDLVTGPYWDYTATLFLSDILGLFVLALLAAILWTFLDRNRRNYARLNTAMRVYARYTVALITLTYAMAKVIPTQFGTLTVSDMLYPLGQFYPSGLLWAFMAASPGYTIFAGMAELSGSVLLFFRRTTLLGGLILAGALANVEAIDLGYNVGAGADAALLLVLDLIILAPYLPWLFDIFIGTGQSRLPHEPLPARQRWYHPLPAKTALLCVVLIPLAYKETLIRGRFTIFDKIHAVHGFFDVTTFTRNGQVVKPLVNDSSTWKCIADEGVFDREWLTVEYANGDMNRFPVSDDVSRRIWTFREGKSKPVMKLNYLVQPDGDVALDGNMGSDAVHLLLHPVDVKKAFHLLSR